MEIQFDDGVRRGRFPIVDEHLHQLRSLSRLNVMETLMAPAAVSSVASVTARTPALYPSAQAMAWKRDEPLREREYPLIGCDACGALPDDATPYHPAAPMETATDETAPLPVDPSPTPPAEAAAGEPAPVNEPAAIEAPQ